MKTLVVCSGGLDSVTLAHLVQKNHELGGLVSFDYGQRHQKEIGYAEATAERLGCSFDLIDLRNVGALLSGSALTSDLDVPDGHYEAESMKLTVVPNRNAIMLSVAFGIASARDHDAVAIAVHGGDHFIYPDCRPKFIGAFQRMQTAALGEFGSVTLYAPFVEMSKAEIVSVGSRIGVPFAETWSCYKGLANHCGRCGTCVERKEAFSDANVIDPTQYDDPSFWRGLV